MQVPQDSYLINQIQHKIDPEMGRLDFQLKVYNQITGSLPDVKTLSIKMNQRYSYDRLCHDIAKFSKELRLTQFDQNSLTTTVLTTYESQKLCQLTKQLMREIQKLSNTDQLLLDCCNSSLFQIEQAKGKDLENAKLEYLMNAFQSMLNLKK